MIKSNRLKFPHYWICEKCAIKKGGRWPEGHVATVTVGICKYCKIKTVVIVPWVDFNWPDNKLTTAAKKQRD